MRERARRAAAAPFIAPDTTLPEALTTLDYSRYQDIRFRPDSALWGDDTPFELQFFHRGFLFPEEVRVHVVEEATSTAVPFDPSWFNYGESVGELTGRLPEGLGYAGFRIHYPINDPDSKDEIAVFLGASYYRLVGPGQVHGLSTRGIAVDVIGSEREEFPDFREFWVVRPAAGDTSLVFHGLLDGPSLTGAYRFELLPTDTATVLAVEAELFARADVARLGVAPLTSMFLYGANRAGEYDDFRPRVHDSDGLLMYTSAGEWIWRPITNRAELQVTSLQDRGPAGFGLLQRERDFDHYLDLEARYHQRPSQWVALGDGDWGSGGVELVEIPGESEFGDNIVAYWQPEAPFAAGEVRRFEYVVRTFDSRLPEQTVGQVERTVIGWDALPGQGNPPPRSRRRFVVDFEWPGDPPPGAGAPIAAPDAPVADGTGAPEIPVEAVFRTSSGVVSEVVLIPLPDDAGWRATFSLEPDGTLPADMGLFLSRDGERLTETWSYLWIPDDDG